MSSNKPLMAELNIFLLFLLVFGHVMNTARVYEGTECPCAVRYVCLFLRPSWLYNYMVYSFDVPCRVGPGRVNDHIFVHNIFSSLVVILYCLLNYSGLYRVHICNLLPLHYLIAALPLNSNCCTACPAKYLNHHGAITDCGGRVGHGRDNEYMYIFFQVSL